MRHVALGLFSLILVTRTANAEWLEVIRDVIPLFRACLELE